MTAQLSGRIVADSARCTNCKTCEMVCSLVHEGRVSPALARLRIEQDPFVDVTPLIIVCEQCADPACLLACPADAIGLDALTGVPFVDEQQCIACGACVDACESGMIALLPDERAAAFKCDLCGGDPQCVRSCPQGALIYGDRSE